MARNNDSERYELSDAEKRDLVKLINEGKPLPEKYRFLLFEDKREVELVWNGKSREVCNAVLPFQTLEHIDEPRREKHEEEELALDTGGRQVGGWTNKLIWGDNKLILSSLKSGALRHQIEEAGGLKLIYIDPPFDVGADFSMDIEIGGETFHKEPNLLEQIAYRDTWGRGADSFISMIYERLILMRDLLRTDGSIYVHCDWRVNSAIRFVMGEVFGNTNFRNEIIRIKCNPKNYTTSAFGNYHDTIVFFSKSESTQLNRVLDERDADELSADFPMVEEKTGRHYTTGALHAKGLRQGVTGQPWRGVSPPSGRHWAYVPETLDKFDAAGLIEWSSNGNPRLKRYADEDEGKVVQDIWEYKDPGDRSADYATQKPEELLERIINASSSPGDLVADFFCGSGTAAAVAEKLERKWIATDLGKFGIHTTRKRLIGVQRGLKAAGKPFRAFEVLNLGRYERQAYLNVSNRLSAKKKADALAKKERDFRELILRAYRAEPIENVGFFHGKHAGRLVVVGPINLPVGRLFVEEVITECRKRRASRADILAFEFEMGLFPAVLEEAKQKGIDIAPKTIPPEVFDKRAVEKGQVRFHDVSYIEATPRYDKNDKRRVAIELADFSVYYSQGMVDSVTAEMKEGKSEVVCEAGKLIKISKDKKGVVTREVLTKKWTDWVDYWAVDFDYESRQEIVKMPKTMGVEGELPGTVVAGEEFIEFEERWTGAYIFENEWQSFRTRQDRELELTSAAHVYSKPGRYTVAVKVIDIFGNDTMTLVPVNVS
ncbi:MAG: site-specific DNA-methyltransferase [Elusimicrobia bacterium]|nr:site-specific DNA-methyltransferase [Elusimicrobiota bacterium]